MNDPSPIIFSSPDAGSRSAGEALKRARESQGMTLEALAAMIKVTPAKLDALEQGRHEQLPDANFTRALAMTVCRALKMDPGEVLAGLPAARPAPLAQGRPPLNQPFKESKGGSPLFDRHTMNWSMLLTPKYLAPAVLLIGALLIYVLPDSVLMPKGPLFSSQVALPEPDVTGVVNQTAPEAVGAASAASAVPALTAPPLQLDAVGRASGVSVAPAELAAPEGFAAPLTPSVALTVPPVTSAATFSVAAPVATTATPATSSLSLTVSRTSWIDVTDAQGNKLFSRVAKTGENLALEGGAPLRVRIGNAAGVQVSYKGQPVDLSSFTRNNIARLELK